MGTLSNTVQQLAALRDNTRPFARPIVALVAGIAITFTYDITTFTALTWLVVIVTVSVLLGDGPKTTINKVALWATVVVAVMTVLGLAMGRMSTATALSLSIALVAFETSRAITRGDRIWLWSTGVLAVGLTIAYFNVDANDRTAAGLTGGWAIIAGVFGLIAAADGVVKRRRAAQEKEATKRAPVSPTPRKATATPAKPKTTPKPPTTKAKPRAPKR